MEGSVETLIGVVDAGVVCAFSSGTTVYRPLLYQNLR